jgi:predicted transcriptional regulator
MKKQRIKEIIKEEITKCKWGIVTEELDRNDEAEIREIIRKEVSAIFFDLFKKRKTWGA